jgi:hypothetical protein
VPAPISVTANQTATFSINVTTVAASSSATLLDELSRDSRKIVPSTIAPSNIAQIFFPAMCALVLFLRRREECRTRLSHAPRLATLAPTLSASTPMTIAAFLALSLFAIAGCGGASTAATATTVMPTSTSQTYTITITPTATTSDSLPVPNVQPIHLTLVVN